MVPCETPGLGQPRSGESQLLPAGADELAERGPPGRIDDERRRTEGGDVALGDPEEVGQVAEELRPRRRPARLPPGVGGLRDTEDLDDGGLGEASCLAFVPEPLGQRWEIRGGVRGVDHSDVSSERTAIRRASRSAEGWTAPFSHRRIVSSLTPSWAARSRRRFPACTRDASRRAPRRGDQTMSSVRPLSFGCCPACAAQPAVNRGVRRSEFGTYPQVLSTLYVADNRLEWCSDADPSAGRRLWGSRGPQRSLTRPNHGLGFRAVST